MDRVALKDLRKQDYFYEEAVKTLRTNIQFLREASQNNFAYKLLSKRRKKLILRSHFSTEMGKTGKRVL